MNVLQIIVQTFLPTFVCFSASKLIGGTFPNIICAFLIFFISWNDQILQSMGTFIWYLILDLFWREDIIPKDIKIHHTVCGFLTLIGLICLLDLPHSCREEANVAIGSLLNMEITSPILHFGKSMKDRGHKFEAAIALLILILLWIPLRIYNPFLSFLVFYEMSFIQNNPLLLVASGLIFILSFLQLYWLYRLILLIPRFKIDTVQNEQNL